MFKKKLQKPDGRALYLYSQNPIADDIVATSPINDGSKPNPHMRWHPLRKEWVVYASHRQNRTFLPPKDYSPLAVSKNKDFPTEMPAGNYQVAVFENLFPSLTMAADDKPSLSAETAPAKGVCEVVVFTQDPDSSLGDLPVSHIKTVLEVWGERTKEIAANGNIKYVMPFENRGVEMGVTLHHPHGQIYAYPFIPPIQEGIFNSMKEFYLKNKKTLLQQMVEEEIKDGRRVLVENKSAIAFVPVCARYTYETWITLKRPVQYLHQLSAQEIQDLAIVLKTVLLKFDKMWQKTFPYLMIIYQAPTDGNDNSHAHLYFQLTPPYRTQDRLKFLAGTELGAGIFINDSLPEEKAAELKAVQVEVKND